MGGFASVIKRLLNSITPWNTRAGGGHYVDYLPPGAPVTLTADTAAAWVLGDQAVLVTTAQMKVAGVPVDAWIEAIEFSAATAAGTFIAAITMAPIPVPLGPPVAATIECLLPAYLGIAAANPAGALSMVIPVRPPIYVRGDAQICGAVMASTTALPCDVRLILSRNR